MDTSSRVAGFGSEVRDGARVSVTRGVISASGGFAVYARGASAGTSTAISVSGSTLEGSYVGAYAYSTAATATVTLAVRDSQLDRNDYGMYAASGAGAPVWMTASASLITGATQSGITVDGSGARVWATGNTVTASGIGVRATAGGVFESAGDTAVRNNGTNKRGTIAVVAME